MIEIACVDNSYGEIEKHIHHIDEQPQREPRNQTLHSRLDHQVRVLERLLTVAFGMRQLAGLTMKPGHYC